MIDQIHADVPNDPDKDCDLCPRLVSFRTDCREKYRDWFNGPVPSWGDDNPKLVIVGLAPGLKGANRTGRPFTGDHAGDLLFETLGKAGVTTGTYAASAEDGLALKNVVITNAVRCVPPQNKPVGAEIKSCAQFLRATLKAHISAASIIALGRIAHESLLTTIGEKKADFPFSHGAQHKLSTGQRLFDSYHCSRYNTNTKRLTPQMFEDVVFAACAHADILNPAH